MSFKCEITGKMSRRGDPRVAGFVHINDNTGETVNVHGSEKCNKIVVATRAKEYKHYDHESQEEWFSYGTEIVKEVNVTEEGLTIWNRWTDEQRLEFAKLKGWL